MSENTSKKAVDLEHFPTSDTANRMMSYIAEGFYEKSYVGKWMFESMGIEMDNARQIVEELQYQAFIETATWGLMYHEMMYGVSYSEQKTLEERRAALLEIRNFRAPMNPERVKKIVESILKTPSQYEVVVTENIDPYTFEISILLLQEVLSKDTDYEKIREKIRSVKPSHLSFLLSGKHTEQVFVHVKYVNLMCICIALLLQLLHNSSFLFLSDMECNESIDSCLVVEKDLWCLDGEEDLSGTRKLDAEVIVYKED